MYIYPGLSGVHYPRIYRSTPHQDSGEASTIARRQMAVPSDAVSSVPLYSGLCKRVLGNVADIRFGGGGLGRVTSAGI